MKTWEKKYRSVYRLIILPFIVWLILIEFSIFIFREIRNLFPPTEIDKTKIVGYVQYNGYPFYFDTFAYLLFIFSPFLVMFAIKIITVIKNKKCGH